MDGYRENFFRGLIIEYLILTGGVMDYVLSSVFSDGAILQRDSTIRVYGFSNVDAQINCDLRYMGFGAGNSTPNSSQARLEKGKRWEVSMRAMPKGGPYELTCGEIKIHDIYFGDVFVLGGQSNMELMLARTLDLYEDEIKNEDDAYLRIFNVPHKYDFKKKHEIIEGGRWIKAAGESVMDFSAAGFFFAKKMRKDNPNVPIGLIQTAVGGTPVHSWISEEHLTKADDELIFSEGRILSKFNFPIPSNKFFLSYMDRLAFLKVPGYVDKIIEADNDNMNRWNEEAEAEKKNVIEKGTLRVPGMFLEGALKGFIGAMWVTKKITVTKEMLDGLKENRDEKNCLLRLGALVDADDVYINDNYVGSTGYCYPPRKYQFSSSVLKEGENEIKIFMRVFRKVGGFVPDKRYEMILGTSGSSYNGKMLGEKADGKIHTIDLSGKWEYAVCTKKDVLADQTFFEYEPAGLFNGMIAPLSGLSVKAVAFYQGESDTDRPDDYEYKFECMVADWRDVFRSQALPFVYVQLADFTNIGLDDTVIKWKIMQGKQASLQKLNNVKMATAKDLGEYNDLHPQRKKLLGLRIAEAMHEFDS